MKVKGNQHMIQRIVGTLSGMLIPFYFIGEGLINSQRTPLMVPTMLLGVVTILLYYKVVNQGNKKGQLGFFLLASCSLLTLFLLEKSSSQTIELPLILINYWLLGIAVGGLIDFTLLDGMNIMISLLLGGIMLSLETEGSHGIAISLLLAFMVCQICVYLYLLFKQSDRTMC